MVIMEYKVKSYNLSDIKQQMVNIAGLRMTYSARKGMFELGFNNKDAVNAIQGIKDSDFYKSMTTNNNHKLWQDVYRTLYKGVMLYIKFQQDSDGYFTISFKELNNE